MVLTFMGTGAAWGLPELNCRCRICSEMRARNERRRRVALLFSGKTNLLVDCGPDIASQLSRHPVEKLDGVLITHEHGDHYIGLDDLSSFKRTRPRGEFTPIPLHATSGTWQVIKPRFSYLVDTGILSVHEVEPNRTYTLGSVEFVPFKTFHGPFAAGSVGYLLRMKGQDGREIRVVYTSDFMDVLDFPAEADRPHYLIIQSHWFHEPAENRPHHMSFQRALDFVRLWKPEKQVFLVHLGDSDRIPGDPANAMMKKAEPMNPLRPPAGGEPYPVPLHHRQWQETVNQVVADFGLPHEITVAQDDLVIPL